MSHAFDSQDEALALRDTLAARLDSLILAAGATDRDRVTDSLTDLRAAVVRDLTTRAADLTRVVTVTPAITLPSLVVAQTLYGDAPERLLDMEADLTARNKARHPGFLRGGDALKVKANV